jgi:hypothetical protein
MDLHPGRVPEPVEHGQSTCSKRACFVRPRRGQTDSFFPWGIPLWLRPRLCLWQASGLLVDQLVKTQFFSGFNAGGAVGTPLPYPEVDFSWTDGLSKKTVDEIITHPQTLPIILPPIILPIHLFLDNCTANFRTGRLVSRTLRVHSRSFAVDPSLHFLST